MISCSGCDARWTATGAAHCAAPGCHRTFSAPKHFDVHRSQRGEHGRCLEPSRIRSSRDGYRLLFFRDGMWRGREMSEEAKARIPR